MTSASSNRTRNPSGEHHEETRDVGNSCRHVAAVGSPGRCRPVEWTVRQEERLLQAEGVLLEAQDILLCPKEMLCAQAEVLCTETVLLCSQSEQWKDEALRREKRSPATKDKEASHQEEACCVMWLRFLSRRSLGLENRSGVFHTRSVRCVFRLIAVFLTIGPSSFDRIVEFVSRPVRLSNSPLPRQTYAVFDGSRAPMFEIGAVAW